MIRSPHVGPAALRRMPVPRGIVPGVALSIALVLGGCASTQVLQPYTTDGCSRFPDRSAEDCWANCCAAHDRTYWRGGTATERLHSDAPLHACVTEHGLPALADVMYQSVRLGGLVYWPTGFRWAYGWGYGRGHQPLTPPERQRANDLLARYQNTPPGPATAATRRCVRGRTDRPARARHCGR